LPDIGFRIAGFHKLKGNPLTSDTAIIKPRREKGEPIIGPDAIMAAIPSDLDYMVSLAQAERVAPKSLSPFRLYNAKRGGNALVSLAGPLLGAPQSVMVLEKLIALGTERIWVLGWCGSLQPSIKIGSLVIPTTGLCEEGTSAHYQVMEEKRQTSPLLNERIENALARARMPFTKGPVWTTDAIYRETEEKISAYGKRGFLGVEMEMSALITVAAYRSVKLAGLLIVSDELASLRWNNGVGSEALSKSCREAGRLLLDVCMAGR
jgi:uridine phosphorylase